MHVIALVESNEHVCCRYRISAFRPHLESAGHQLTITPLPRRVLARMKVLHGVRDADAVIVQRKLLSLPELFLLRRSARFLTFDFDDALWLRDSYSPRGFESRKRAGRFRAVVRAADAVVAGNRLLAEEAARHSSTTHVHVIPTCVDPARYLPWQKQQTTESSRPIVMVWVGSSSTLQGLEHNRELFETIGKSVPGARLRIVCDRFPTFTNLPVEAVAWSEATEASAIASADIGIGWVPDDPWSRGKCGLKLLQYQAAGLPVIANPVGVQAEIVRHDETGLLASTTEDWVAALRSLMESPEQRRRLGRAGRLQVESSYSVDAGGRAWLALLHGAGVVRSDVSEARP